MFDLNSINKRYFDIKIGEIEYKIEPPTKKIFNKIIKLSSEKDTEVTNSLYEAVSMILNKNKGNKKVSDETIEEFNFDQINAIITEYFGWLKETKNLPN